MRRILLLIASVSMLAGMTGCKATTGQCDCTDMPPSVVAPPLAQPIAALPAHEAPVAMPGSQTTTVLPSADSSSAVPQRIPR